METVGEVLIALFLEIGLQGLHLICKYLQVFFIFMCVAKGKDKYLELKEAQKGKQNVFGFDFCEL